MTQPTLIFSTSLTTLESLVSQLLNRENYAIWSRAMRIALSAKNKFGFVDGSILPPAEDDPLFSSWQRCNDMVLSWLLNSISPNLASKVLYATYAVQVWKDLAERLRRSNGPRIYQLQRSIASIYQHQYSFAIYYNEFKGFWDELATLLLIPACKCNTSTVLLDLSRHPTQQFLVGLNESYTAIRGQILLMHTLPSVNRVYSLLLQEEAQREVSVVDSNNSPQGSIFCTNFVYRPSLFASPSPRGSGDDNKRPSTPRPPRRNVRCTNCTKWGHTVDKCYSLHGYPPGHKLYKKPANSPNVASSNGSISAPSPPPPH